MYAPAAPGPPPNTPHRTGRAAAPWPIRQALASPAALSRRPPPSPRLADSSIWFWKTSIATLQAGSVVPAPWVIYIFCVANILMTGLQWFWATLILTGIYAMVTGGKAPDADEDEPKADKKKKDQ